MTNNISKVIGVLHSCTGCQICSAVCPNNSIKIVLNEEGFYSPIINNKLCNNCGKCIKSCYKYDECIQMTKNELTIEVFAAFSKDIKILQVSTSGGISSHLINVCLEKNYKVVGVAYNYKENIAVSEITNSLKKAGEFRGSKYIQSYTENTFKKIIKGNKNQKYAFLGTPCQIYALKKWSGYDRLDKQCIFIDFFCHGYPSMHLWKKYIEYIKEKVRKIDKIEFRSKVYGWHEFAHCFSNKNIRVISDKTINDPFFTIYFDNEILNYSCYGCHLRSTLQYTDLRLGDFWGSEYDFNTKGVSAVVVCTEKGMEIFNLIKPKIKYEKRTLNNVIKAQNYGKILSYNYEIRNKVLRLLKSEKNLQIIFKEYLKTYSITKYIYRLLKKLIYILPNKIINRIKKTYHIVIR